MQLKDGMARQHRLLREDGLNNNSSHVRLEVNNSSNNDNRNQALKEVLTMMMFKKNETEMCSLVTP